MKKLSVIFLGLILILSVAMGVPAPVFWYKADALSLGNTSPVATWTDSSTGAYDCILNNVSAGGDCYMNDSRFKPGGTLNITGTITYNNALLNTLQLLNPLPAAPTDINGIIQTLADMGAWQQPL